VRIDPLLANDLSRTAMYNDCGRLEAISRIDLETALEVRNQTLFAPNGKQRDVSQPLCSNVFDRQTEKHTITAVSHVPAAANTCAVPITC
jgi:hypothetical protein